MAAPPFADYSRRIVRLPDNSHVLVLIRRNVESKFNFFNGWDLRWELGLFRRLLRRDTTWRVEMYEGVPDDPRHVPTQEPNRHWVRMSKVEASDLAEQVAQRLGAEGTAGITDLQ